MMQDFLYYFINPMTKIIRIKIGIIYLIKKENSIKAFVLTFEAPIFISDVISCAPKNHPIKIQVKSETRGVRYLSISMEIKSKILFPPIVKSAKIPFESEANIEITDIIRHIIKIDSFLEILKLSIRNEAETSNMEIEEVRAAKRTSKKNITPNALPKGIISKT